MLPDVPVTVTVYAPGVVPGLPPPPLPPLLPPPPHADRPPPMERSSRSMPARDCHLRRFDGMPNSRTSASAAPPADGQIDFFVLLRDVVVAAVVFTVSVVVCAAVPVIVTDAGMLHVAGSLAAVGEMEQARLTAPVNPFEGVSVIVDVLPVVAPGAMVTAVPEIARPGAGAARTLMVSVVVAFTVPEIPVMVAL